MLDALSPEGTNMRRILLIFAAIVVARAAAMLHEFWFDATVREPRRARALFSAARTEARIAREFLAHRG